MRSGIDTNDLEASLVIRRSAWSNNSCPGDNEESSKTNYQNLELKNSITK